MGETPTPAFSGPPTDEMQAVFYERMLLKTEALRKFTSRTV
jgi:hypothetical protein